MFSMNMIMDIGLVLMMEDMREGQDRMKDTSPGMIRVVKEVVIPAIDKNFIAGGRPGWAPLDAATINQRGREGSGATPLIRSGNLLEEATSFDNWVVSQDDAVMVLPENAEYGYVHEDGSANVPARPFMEIPEDDLARADEIMTEWVVDGKS